MFGCSNIGDAGLTRRVTCEARDSSYLAGGLHLFIFVLREQALLTETVLTG